VLDKYRKKVHDIVASNIKAGNYEKDNHRFNCKSVGFIQAQYMKYFYNVGQAENVRDIDALANEAFMQIDDF
jgi:hypothetical protein